MRTNALSAAITTGLQAEASARRVDGNGWYEVAGNPVSKAGIFEYLGAEVPGAPDPQRTYRVLRPPEELADPACIESFRLVPIIDEHTWLGGDSMPAEQKGVHGTTGEAVHFDGEYLRTNLKIFSDAMAGLIAAGKQELSSGYACAYEWVAGLWNGQPYDVIQRNIRANHVALVQEGRMGPEVRVLDQRFTIALDTAEFKKMAENTPSLTLDEITEKLAELQPIVDQVASLNAAMADLQAAGTNAEAAAAAAEAVESAEAVADEAETVEEIAVAAEQGEESDLAALDEKEKALDAAIAKLKPSAKAADAAIAYGKAKARIAQAKANHKARGLDARVKHLEATAGDAAVAGIAARDTLAQRLYPHVGVFDHKAMTHAQVVAYGAEKLELAKGTAADTLDAYLKGREAAAPVARVSDHKVPPADSPIGAYLAPKSKE